MPSSLLASPLRGDIERTCGGRRRHPGFGCAATRRGLDAYTWYASALLSRAEGITDFISCTPDDRILPPLNRIGDPDDIPRRYSRFRSSARWKGETFLNNPCPSVPGSLKELARCTDSRGDVPGDSVVSRLHHPWHHSTHRRARVEAPYPPRCACSRREYKEPHITLYGEKK
jgi:hypothetical protein